MLMGMNRLGRVCLGIGLGVTWSFSKSRVGTIPIITMVAHILTRRTKLQRILKSQVLNNKSLELMDF